MPGTISGSVIDQSPASATRVTDNPLVPQDNADNAVP